MDVAERDQFKASAADWAFQLRANHDALTAVGFTETDALTLLAEYLGRLVRLIEQQEDE